MTETILVSIAVWCGLDFRRAGFLLGAVLFPIPSIGLIGVHWWRDRPRTSARSVMFCETVADELRAGGSMRMALANAADSVEVAALADLARSGAPLTEVAREAAGEFPDVGPELNACVARSTWLGSPTADLFDELAGLALAQVEVRHEVRAAMAPARATALLLVAGPATAIWFASSAGRLTDYVESPTQRMAVGGGLALVLVAIVVGGLMVRRAR